MSTVNGVWNYTLTCAELDKQSKFFDTYWSAYHTAKNQTDTELTDLPDYLKEKNTFDIKA